MRARGFVDALMPTPVPSPCRASRPRLARRAAALAARAAACVFVCVLAGAPAFAQSWGLQTLMHELAARKSGRARFVETKTLRMLAAPIRSSGTLRFAAPDYLEMHTLEPAPQRVVVQAGEVSLQLDGRTRRFSLDAHPEIATLIDGIRATLDGDLAGLRRNYVTRLRGGRRLWTLVLVPRQAAARAQVSEIDVSGSGASVLSIAVFETDGDRSLMTLHELGPP